MKALDTSALIAAEKDPTVRALLEIEEDLIIPAMAAAEFLVGIRLSSKESVRLRAQDFYDEALRPAVLPFDEAQAQTLASLLTENRRTGRTMKMFDAAIAATAIDLACPLIVRDNDFDGIEGLTVEKI